MVHAQSELQKSTDYYTQRAKDIRRGMSSASFKQENLTILREIISQGYEKIMSLFDETEQ